LQIAVQFVHDPSFAVVAGPAHVPRVAMRELPDLAGFHVVRVEVERAAPVRAEVDRVADPHRVAVRAGMIRNPFPLMGAQVEHVQVLRPAALIPFPRAEVPDQWRVRNARFIRRKITRARLRHRERLGHAAVDPHGVELRPGEVPRVAQGAEQNRRAVRGPVVHLVVVAPARGERTACRVERQLLGRAPRGWDDVDLLVAVILAGNGDPSAVRRELRKQLQTRMGRQPGRGAACGRRTPEVAGVAEHHPVPMNVGEPQNFGLGCRGRSREQRDRKEKRQQSRTSGHLRHPRERTRSLMSKGLDDTWSPPGRARVAKRSRARPAGLNGTHRRWGRGRRAAGDDWTGADTDSKIYVSIVRRFFFPWKWRL
jgi:hypothetical protein